MAARSLNKVQLIGNLTRDPELRYTPQGTAVCSFGLATNRTWTTDTGDKKEETEFHRIVAWAKLAELCSQLLFKGRRVYVEGRLQTRQWTAQDGAPRSTTEVVIDDMIILDSRHERGDGEGYESGGDGYDYQGQGGGGRASGGSYDEFPQSGGYRGGASAVGNRSAVPVSGPKVDSDAQTVPTKPDAVDDKLASSEGDSEDTNTEKDGNKTEATDDKKSDLPF